MNSKSDPDVATDQLNIFPFCEARGPFAGCPTIAAAKQRVSTCTAYAAITAATSAARAARTASATGAAFPTPAATSITDSLCSCSNGSNGSTDPDWPKPVSKPKQR